MPRLENSIKTYVPHSVWSEWPKEALDYYASCGSVVLLSASETQKRGRPKLDKPKEQISIRLDRDVLDRWKSTGPGWQKRVNEALKQSILADGGE